MDVPGAPAFVVRIPFLYNGVSYAQGEVINMGVISNAQVGGLIDQRKIANLYSTEGTVEHDGKTFMDQEQADLYKSRPIDKPTEEDIANGVMLGSDGNVLIRVKSDAQKLYEASIHSGLSDEEARTISGWEPPKGYYEAITTPVENETFNDPTVTPSTDSEDGDDDESGDDSDSDDEVPPYEEWLNDDLHAEAEERGLHHPTSLTKDELVELLTIDDTPYAERTVAQLQAELTRFSIEYKASAKKDELVALLEAHAQADSSSGTGS